MKKFIPFLVVICMLPIVLSAVVETPKINVKTAFTDPYPVEPGNSFTLSLEVINNGTAKAENVILELEPIYPFTLREETKKELKNVNIDDTRIIDYKMFVDSSAVSATYELPVYVTYGTSYKLTTSVEIRVQGTPDFKLLDLKSETISPGDIKDIKITLKNVGSGKAKRTTVTFSSTSDDVKPIFSGGNVYVGDFLPDETKFIEFKILASSDSEYGVYTGNVNITYEDEFGNELNKKFEVGILVSGRPKFQVFKSEVEREKREISIEIVNIGTAEAKGISAKLLVDREVFDVDYVTSIKIDKRSTFKFNLPNSRNAELELSYEGPDNTEYTQIEAIAWNIPFTLPSWVWIVLILVIVYVMWKKKLWKKIF